MPWLDGIVRAKQSRYLPVVLTTTEVRTVLAHLKGEYWLVGNLLYGAGLRLSEVLQLRVKDIQLEYRQAIVRSAKGANAVQSPLDRGVRTRRFPTEVRWVCALVPGAPNAKARLRGPSGLWLGD